jgi:hypothetical protein
MLMETWLTDNTEVRTPDGWKNIYDLRMGDSILAINKGKVVQDTIMHISQCNFNGLITQAREAGVITHYKYLHRDNTRLKPIMPASTEKLEYTGRLLHIRGKFNSLIIRTFFSYHSNNGDFTTCLCHVK